MNKIKELILVTGNKGKADNAARLIGFPVTNYKTDLLEIQTLELQEVVEAKLKAAFEIVQKPVIVEDVALEFCEYKRLPGTFIKFFEKELGLEKLCQMLDGKNRAALAKCIIGFTDGANTKYFKGEQSGQIATAPRGENGFGWDRIFISDEFPNKTNAELTESEYNKYFMKMRRFDLLKDYCQRDKI